MLRLIIHLDADAFFASVEQAADPRLRGKPVAVGGEKRGIIASASYEARRFGVFTPMPTVRARKLCPRLIVLPGDFDKYERFSRWMFSYAYDFTPDVEITSIDEGYFDLSGARKSPLEIAQTIRSAIHQALKITVSEGIGSNKLVSQIASKLHKPAAFAHVPHGQEIPFLHPLANRWLPGVGPKTAERLNAAGLAYVRQIAATPTDLLWLIVGNQAPALKEFSNGIDERPLIPVSAPAKSYSQQETFAQDQTDEEFLEATLRRMTDHLMVKVREDAKSIRTVTLKVRYNDMAEDQCSESLAEPTDLESDVYSRLRPMLRAAWKRRVSLRLISLKFANVYEGVFRTALPLERETQQHDARRRLAAVVDELRRTRGTYVVMRGHDLALREEAPKPKLQAPKKSQSTNSKGQAPSSNGLATHKRFGALELGVSLGCGAWSLELPSRRSHSTLAFVPLTARSYYSFLNSTLSPEAIVALARQHGLPAVALCDQGNLHGAVPFVQAAQAAGLKPILGAEVNVEGKPLRLYVQNATGYANLCRILSGKPKLRTPSSKEAPSSKSQASPHTAGSLELGNWDFFGAWSLELGTCTGLLAISSDPSFAPLFPDRFYLDVTALTLASSGSADRLKPGLQTKLPCVVAPPIHYATPEDRWKFDIVQSIRTLTLLKQTHPDKMLEGDFHFRTPAEMSELFKAHPDVLRHTLELAERCTFEFPFGKPQFPAFAPPDGSTPREFLRKLVLAGLEARYGHLTQPATRNTHYALRITPGQSPIADGRSQISNLKSQIDTELTIIADVGYEEYFLVVWDILQECRRRGIEWITRGSAADSLVCYCLGISNVCPIRFDLYFRRFLNKERMALNKLPDIDIDFPHDRKDDVIDLIFEKYGAEHCAVVGGFSTFQARSAFAEVAKVLGVAEREVRRFTEHFPWSFGSYSSSFSSFVLEPKTKTTEDEDEGRGRERKGGSNEGRLTALLRASPECRDLPLEEEPYRSALAMAEFLDGFPRYAKMHPCGVVLSRQPMHELTPTFISQKGYPTTHFDMDAVEAIGLVKIDILAQGGLAAMRDVKAMLRARGVEVDLENLVATRIESGCGESSKLQAPSSKEAPRTKSQTPPCAEGELVRTVQTTERRGAHGAGARKSAPRHDWPTAEFPGEPDRQDTRQTGDWELGAWNLLGTWNLELGTSPPHLSPSPLGQPEPWTDPTVWELIATGNARAVHHIESPAMIGLSKMCNVRDIDTLIAIVSVIRPGAANEDKKREFTRRYQGLSPVTYPHPSLERCLRSTFGLVVYEEHILQICEAFAGLPPGRADVLRRALVKEKQETIAEIAKEFVACARARGHPDDKIAEGWQLVAGFHGYAFCKAHSTAYGVEAYQSAWLKRYFPAEFMAAVLTNGKGFYHPLVYVLECWRLGVPPVGPWVNQPGPEFAVVYHEERSSKLQAPRSPKAPNSKSQVALDGSASVKVGAWNSFGTWSLELGASAIRVPVTRVKGLTERTTERLLAERARGEFASVRDFYRRVGPLPEELEALIRVGAFDGFGQPRTAQFWEAQFLRRTYESDLEPGQGWLFPPPSVQELFRGNARPARDVSLSEPSRKQRLQWEVELLDFPASGHPLELYDDIAWETYCPVAKLGEHIGEQVVTCGLVIEQRVHHQTNGEPMKFLTLADWTGIVETELFAATYKSYGLATVRYPVLEITATVEPFENSRGFSLRVHRAGKPRTKSVGAQPK